MKHIIALGALALLAMPVTMATALVGTHDITGALPADAQPFAEALGSYYVGDDGSIWMESNGVAGLQEQGTNDDQGQHAADTLVLGAPAAPALPEMPALPAVPL